MAKHYDRNGKLMINYRPDKEYVALFSVPLEHAGKVADTLERMHLLWSRGAYGKIEPFPGDELLVVKGEAIVIQTAVKYAKKSYPEAAVKLRIVPYVPIDRRVKLLVSILGAIIVTMIIHFLF